MVKLLLMGAVHLCLRYDKCTAAPRSQRRSGTNLKDYSRS